MSKFYGFAGNSGLGVSCYWNEVVRLRDQYVRKGFKVKCFASYEDAEAFAIKTYNCLNQGYSFARYVGRLELNVPKFRNQIIEWNKNQRCEQGTDGITQIITRLR